MCPSSSFHHFFLTFGYVISNIALLWKVIIHRHIPLRIVKDKGGGGIWRGRGGISLDGGGGGYMLAEKILWKMNYSILNLYFGVYIMSYFFTVSPKF